MLAIFFICLWFVIMTLFLYSVILAFKEGAAQIKKMHQIPCHNCDFFTNDFRLKCTVNPTIACTEEAISCHDFEVKTANANSVRKVRASK